VLGNLVAEAAEIWSHQRRDCWIFAAESPDYAKLNLLVFSDISSTFGMTMNDLKKISSPKQFHQEAQLMLTNTRDAVRGQSRSPNIVPFHMLCVVSVK